ncbi:MAG: hypothetical protein MK103_08320 [Planctomycetes bacterium]|nr:hypothetical protein [Planctomycetota bacterium]
MSAVSVHSLRNFSDRLMLLANIRKPWHCTIQADDLLYRWYERAVVALMALWGQSVVGAMGKGAL